jgi:[histone H3]-N6,N6-dimethyl-L-lysine4 FAD-dependent demethylase
MIVGWINGNERFEKLTDEQIIKDITDNVLTRFHSKSIPKPKILIRSKWNSNEYVRGSYSSISCKSNGDDYDILAEPVTFGNVIK